MKEEWKRYSRTGHKQLGRAEYTTEGEARSDAICMKLVKVR